MRVSTAGSAHSRASSTPSPTAGASTQGPLVIDTVGPKVTNVMFNRLAGQVLVTFKDERSGLNQSSIVDANNYAFNKILTKPLGTFLVNGLQATPQGPLATSPEQVAV